MAPKYYMAENASALERVWRRYVRKQIPAPAFPTDMQIQTRAGCNARCVFCPSMKTRIDIRPEPMDKTLYERIVDEALERGTQRISPFLMNEPLADPDVAERIAYISNHRLKTDRTVTKINSNGSLLSEAMAKRLLDSGLDRISFSVHGIRPEPYEETMVGLKLGRVLANIDRFLELKRAGGYKKPRIRVTMVRTKVLEPQIEAIKAYWGARLIKVNIRALENRSHESVKTYAEQAASRQLSAYDWCKRMFEQAYILNTGELALCCVDWERSAIMGDARKNTIAEIWNGPVYRQMRERFLRGDVQGTLCDGCSKDNVEEE